jgi:hypothetical protein
MNENGKGPSLVSFEVKSVYNNYLTSDETAI